MKIGLFTLVLGIAALAACDDDDGCTDSGCSCTDIGCLDGLTIEVVDANGTALSTFSGVVVADDVGYEVDCPGSTSDAIVCETSGLRIPGAPDVVDIDLEANSGFISGSLHIEPVYQESFPNGAGCGSCVQDSERLVLR